MGTTYFAMVAFPALKEVCKLLAILVALYFPIAMLAWLAIDKFQRRAGDAPASDRHDSVRGGATLSLGRNSRQNV